MILKQGKTKKNIRKNNIFILLTLIYTAILIIISSIACFFAYQQKQEEILSQMDMTFVRLEQKYLNSINNFWKIYMPLYESHSNFHSVLTDYFISDLDEALEPLKKRELSNVLMQMMMRDEQVQWIALYSEVRKFNYILFRNSRIFETLPDDFPYLKKITSKSGMEIYGMENISDGSTIMNTYAICGGAPSNILSGVIIAGYSTSELEYICKNAGSTLKSLNYTLLSNDEILFDSSGTYDKELLYLPKDTMTDIVNIPGGEKLYVHSDIIGKNGSVLSYTVSWHEMFRYASGYTFYILLIVLMFVLLSVALYSLILRFISREVNTIRHGLKKIGENNLDYRIPTNFNQGGLSEVAESINHMAVRLKNNINRAYYYEIKQKEAELSELQAKFNPHFLYNSLEMLRFRCCKNGDADTANLITQLSAIFRGFIGSRTFIPIPEELAFSKRYLSLFGARYGDQVQVRYDIDTEVLKYGIIRNVFQPLIENYFVHGFDTSVKDNCILFRGKSLDDKTIMLSLEDNGNGMSDEELQQLNANLQEPVQIDTDSYGLKNLHQRLHLFYGGNCGLTVERNGEKGLSLRMTLLKLTCEEYEQSRDFK
jgi:sensor histidine kinase YesM